MSVQEQQEHQEQSHKITQYGVFDAGQCYKHFIAINLRTFQIASAVKSPFQKLQKPQLKPLVNLNKSFYNYPASVFKRKQRNKMAYRITNIYIRWN